MHANTHIIFTVIVVLKQFNHYIHKVDQFKTSGKKTNLLEGSCVEFYINYKRCNIHGLGFYVIYGKIEGKQSRRMYVILFL